MSMGKKERVAAYAILASRVNHWDQLLWQMPVLSMTAQAFLFTISLGPDTSQVARTIACILSMATLWLIGASIVRQRQSAIADADWLTVQEADWDEPDRQFGITWRDRRNNTGPDVGLMGKFFPRTKPMINWWLYCFAFFGLIDIVIIALAWSAPSLLAAGH